LFYDSGTADQSGAGSVQSVIVKQTDQIFPFAKLSPDITAIRCYSGIGYQKTQTTFKQNNPDQENNPKKKLRATPPDPDPE